MPATPKLKSDKATVDRKDPYVVLGVLPDATDQEIKSAYRRMALKYVLCLLVAFRVSNSDV